jgi:transposase
MARASEWAKRVASWRASGLSAERFCEGKDYSVASLRHWSSQVGRAKRAAEAKRPRSVRLARVVRATSGAATPGIFVEVAGARVEVRGPVDAEALRAVVYALRHAAPGAST